MDMTCQLRIPLNNIMHIHFRTNRENMKKQQLWIEPAKKRKCLNTQLLTAPKYDSRQFAVWNEHLPHRVVITHDCLTRINAHSHVGPSRNDDLTEQKCKWCTLITICPWIRLYRRELGRWDFTALPVARQCSFQW